MNTRARLARLERTIKKPNAINPERIAAVLAYLRTGQAEQLPAGVTFEELQAAARKLGPAAAGKCAGVAELREALAETLKGRDVLAYIEAGRPVAVKSFHVKDGEQAPTWPAAAFLRRLGFTIIRIDSIITPAQAGA